MTDDAQTRGASARPMSRREGSRREGQKRTRAVVEKLECFPWGARRFVTVNGATIGVINVGGTFHALLNRCPHHGAPLCEGTVKGTMDDTQAHEYCYVRSNEYLVCPWHGYEFALATGRARVDPDRLRVRTYDVAIEDGDVVVYV